MKKKRLFLMLGVIGGLSLLAVAIREIYCGVMYIYNVALKRGDKTFLTRLIDVSKEADVLCDDIEEEGERIAKWAIANKSEEVYIDGYNNTRLYGEIFKNSSHKWVIILHGYGGDCTLMYYVGEIFHNKGYNALLPDLRGHGKSGGGYIGMGWHDRLDVLRWIEEIKKEDKRAEIVLYGVSMGGATVMMTSGEKLDKRVKAIIEDCGYTSVKDIFLCQMKKLKVPSFPFLYLTAFLCQRKNKYNLLKASAIEQVKKSKVPMLFIHGENDGFVPPQMLDMLYNAKKKGFKERFMVKGAGHGVSAMVDKEEYWGRVFGFLDRWVD